MMETTVTHYKVQSNSFCQPDEHPGAWRDDNHETYATAEAAETDLKECLQEIGWPHHPTPVHYRIVRVETTVVKEYLLPEEERITYAQRVQRKKDREAAQ